jgi:mannan endo-1,4-beta-mannosidase
MWQKGDQLTGDPPHEPQGWYSVYNTDSTTQRLIRDYADRLSRFGEK